MPCQHHCHGRAYECPSPYACSTHTSEGGAVIEDGMPIQLLGPEPEAPEEKGGLGFAVIAALAIFAAWVVAGISF